MCGLLDVKRSRELSEGGHVLLSRFAPEGGEEMLLATHPDGTGFIGEPYPFPGAEIQRRPDERRWLVVDHVWDVINLPAWPIRVWRVTDVVPAPAEEQVAPWYTRASALRIVEELDAWRVFGEHGWKVAAIIERSAAIDRDDAAALANGREDGAGDAYNRAWETWRQRGPAHGSPIGRGLILVDRAVQRAAKAIDLSLFKFDPVDQVDVLNDRTWIRASHACLEAALAFGAPDLVPRADAGVMTAAWRARFNSPRTEATDRGGPTP